MGPGTRDDRPGREGETMRTQLEAWRRAWAHVDAEVQRGVLTSRGTPIKRVRQHLFRTLFPELGPQLTAYVHQHDVIQDSEQDLIVRATREHGADLVTVTAVATFVRRWIVTTPELTRRRAGGDGSADLWAPKVREMIQEAGGVRALAQQGEEAWTEWLRARFHVGAERPEELIADAEAIRTYVLADGVADLLGTEVARAWAARPVGPPAPPDALEPVGLNPARVPVEAARAAIEEGADALLAAWPDDALSRVLGLTGTSEGSPLSPPPVLAEDDAAPRHVPSGSRGDEAFDQAEEDDDEATPGLAPPRDRSLLLRLVHRNTRGAGSDRRAITVQDLVHEEIERCASPLALLGPASRRALVAAGASLAQTRWIDDPADARKVTADHPDKYLLLIAVQVRRCFFARHTRLELLPVDTQRRIAHPATTFGPRLWSRLHNWERDGKMTDPYLAVESAWRSWLKDLRKPSADSPPPPRPLDALPGAPGVDGAPVGPGVILSPASHLPFEDVVTALRHLAETLGEAVRDFVSDAWAGLARQADWAELTARADAEAPGIIADWPTFEAVLDYLTELRSDRP